MLLFTGIRVFSIKIGLHILLCPFLSFFLSYDFLSSRAQGYDIICVCVFKVKYFLLTFNHKAPYKSCKKILYFEYFILVWTSSLESV